MNSPVLQGREIGDRFLNSPSGQGNENKKMQFLNPLMLWSALAVGVPIVLHFWHQKKGKLLLWAATQWLTEKDLQQSKGIRIENILLLIMRCLLVCLLAFLLAKPYINPSAKDVSYQKIHLVQPNRWVTNNFKFEIENALKKGEKVYWINDKLEVLQDLNQQTSFGEEELHPLLLQTSINKVARIHKTEQVQYELYLVNHPALSQVSNIILPSVFALHSVVDTTYSLRQNYLELADNQKLFVNANNQLTVAMALPNDILFKPQPIRKGELNILINTVNKPEKQAIRAALKALNEVYQLNFSVDEATNKQKKYDWVLDDNMTDVEIRKSLENKRLSGELPEYIGEEIIKKFQLKPSRVSLSQQQLQSLFTTKTLNAETAMAGNKSEAFSKALLLMWVLIFGIERWLAIKKNA